MNNYHKRASTTCFFRKRHAARHIGRVSGLPKCTGAWKPSKPYKDVRMVLHDKSMYELPENIWRVTIDAGHKRGN